MCDVLVGQPLDQYGINMMGQMQELRNERGAWDPEQSFLYNSETPDYNFGDVDFCNAIDQQCTLYDEEGPYLDLNQAFYYNPNKAVSTEEERSIQELTNLYMSSREQTSSNTYKPQVWTQGEINLLGQAQQLRNNEGAWDPTQAFLFNETAPDYDPQKVLYQNAIDEQCTRYDTEGNPYVDLTQAVYFDPKTVQIANENGRLQNLCELYLEPKEKKIDNIIPAFLKTTLSTLEWPHLSLGLLDSRNTNTSMLGQWLSSNFSPYCESGDLLKKKSVYIMGQEVELCYDSLSNVLNIQDRLLEMNQGYIGRCHEIMSLLTLMPLQPMHDHADLMSGSVASEQELKHTSYYVAPNYVKITAEYAHGKVIGQVDLESGNLELSYTATKTQKNSWYSYFWN
ncbi:MAG: hypothetical protein CMO81_06440 [Waddliaceae bacterium]|nr:hypothetical protein [Waddliaceae bacterium]